MDEKWVTSNNPCFDLICNDEECYSTALITPKERVNSTDCNRNDCNIDHDTTDDVNIEITQEEKIDNQQFIKK